MSGLIRLPNASSLEHLQALAEVSDFASTDMGHDGQGPWTYRKMTEPVLAEELLRLSNAQSSTDADAVSFQPCLVSENQDRYIVQAWDLPGGSWVFCAVLDGHVNRHCVDYVQSTLPSILKMALTETLLNANSPFSFSPDAISITLAKTLIMLDDTITSDLSQLLPQQLLQSNPAAFGKVAEAESGLVVASRCLGGATVIFSLLDPSGINLWVANLGDCQAVFGCRDDTGRWYGTAINDLHNARADREIQRLRLEHPGELDVVKDGRVLGYLEPTRAIGDTWSKLPKDFTEQFFLCLKQDWIPIETLQRCARRIQTPPYISNTPDVYHRVLTDQPSFLILCSDGLGELYNFEGSTLVDHWISVVGTGLDYGDGRNLALCLLRDAIGGNDLARASQLLTVEMEETWMDDTTIVIQRLHPPLEGKSGY